MKTFPPDLQAVRISFATLLIALISVSVPEHATAGTPQPERYAALLAKARAGTLRVTRGEIVERPGLFPSLAAATPAAPPDVFTGKYRKTAKTSFTSGPVNSFATLDSLLGALPQDSKMARDFPKLLTKADTARVAPENRTVKVNAFIYFASPEEDRDFHVILGSTAEFTDTTTFMNVEISGLPPARPTLSPFPQRRADIRKILAKNKNERGLFVTPVRVQVTGPLFWDGEHRFPNNVGPESLRPTKAWEIHPVQLLAEQ